MSIQVIVFDFDGTLVDSNRLKHDAFFELFPDDDRYRRIVRDVLAAYPEETRFSVLAEMLRRIRLKGLPPGGQSVELLASKYNMAVVAAVKACPEIQGATATLASLSRKYALYLSSNTPQEALQEIVRYRGWDRFFKKTFGYPSQKSAMLSGIMTSESCAANQLLMVGDGESDRRSAAAIGCLYFRVGERSTLRDLPAYLDGNR